MKHFIYAITLILLSGHWASGALRFYGFQEDVVNDSTLLYRQKFLSYTTLEKSVIKVTPKGAYLDITEDAWISSDIPSGDIEGLTRDYFLKSELYLPPRAAITGLITWIKSKPYKARLKPTVYSFDKYFTDSVALGDYINGRVAFLQQASEGEYRAVFTQLSLGEVKHIRIRYLLPNQSGGTGGYHIPVVFNGEHGRVPEATKLVLLMNNKKHKYILTTPSGELQIRDTTTIMVPYASGYDIRHGEGATAALHVSEIPDGDLEGHYAYLNASFPDSLLETLSRKMEVVLVWRWNRPFDLVDFDGSGLKNVSAKGLLAIQQAGELKNLVEDLAQKGHGVGLIHTLEDSVEKALGVSYAGGDSLELILNYLDQFNAYYIYDHYNPITTEHPEWVPQAAGAESYYDKKRGEFYDAVEKATAMFGADSALLKHLAVLSLGSGQATINKLTTAGLDSLLGPVTLDAGRGQWTGFNFNTLVATPQQQHLSPWQGFYFPFFQPSTIKVNIRDRVQTYSFPVAANDGEMINVVLKSSRAWDTTITWVGYDPYGDSTGALSITPFNYETELDTGLAKVWARDIHRVTEKEEDQLGARYGLVTGGSYLAASSGDRVSFSGNSVPYLERDEIDIEVTPVAPVTRVYVHRLQHYIRANALYLGWGTDMAYRSIEVYDFRGRLIARLSLAGFLLNRNEAMVPLTEIGLAKKTGMYLVRVRGISKTSSFKLIL